MKFAKTAFVMCILLTLAGCGRVKKINNFEMIKEPVEINIINNWYNSDTRLKAFSNIVDSFNAKHPNILIKVNSIAEEKYLERLRIDFSSGNEPDIFIAPVNSDTRKLANQNKIAPLNEFLTENDEIFESFDESALKYVVWNGKIIALPLEKTYTALFINNDILKKYNISPPSTYEEFFEAVSILSKTDTTPVAFNTTPDGLLMYKVMCAMITGNIGSNIYTENKEINPAYIAGADYLKELYMAGAFPNNLFTISDKAADELFISKKAAMIVRNTSFIGKLYSSPLDNADNTVILVPFPKMPNTKTASTALLYGIGTDCIMVSRSSYDNPKKQDAITKIIKHLASADSMQNFVQENASISTIKLSPPPTIHYRPLMQSVFRIINKSKEIISYSDSFSDEEIWNNISSKMPYFLTDRISTNELLSPR